MSFAVLLIQLALAQTPSRPLLDVPFVSQTPALCGGAAVSMVLRYWGARDVFPQDFAPLVSESDGGIFTGVLAKSVSDRGWHALVEPASAATTRSRVRAEIDRGRPVIALIQVAPRTYHYVVLVGSTDAEVVFHDPARAPFRVLAWTDFERAWASANYWMMVALPPAGFTAAVASEPAPPIGTSAPATPCSALVDDAIKAATAGRTAEAEQQLAAAMRLCPTDAAPPREMAGLRFSQKRWSDANELATASTRLAPGDGYAWELAATSRFLMGDTVGALAAWNRIGQPKVDGVTIHGADRTRAPVVVAAAALAPRSVLTPGAFSKALRRVRDLPVVAAANVKLEPLDAGLANVDVSIVEKSPWPRGRASVLILAARPLTQREVRVDVAGVTGEGESAFVAWRFATRRPRVAAGLAFPSPRWLPGVTAFSAMWEQQTYAAVTTGAEPFRETRRRAGLQLSDWMSGWWKWQAGGALDRFDSDTYAAADASVIVRPHRDLAALRVSAGQWLPLSRGTRFRATSARAALRSTADASRPAFSASVEVQRASAAAPLAIWPSAGTGMGGDRASFLRGHQLIDDGVVLGDVLGRALVNGSLEYARPVRAVRGATLAIAGFADVARASLRRSGLAPTPAYVDAGLGLRVRLPGNLGGVRFDVAHRVGGPGRTIVSAGWLAAWPQ